MAQTADSLKTRAERTNFTETTRYDEVLTFINEAQKRTPLMTVEYFGETNEGRRLPLVIFSDPPVRQPRDLRATGKLVVFVLANIHGGEVEGKEATLNLIREFATAGPLTRHLKDLVILLAPIYNADGNEKIDLKHRAEQNGPINGVGTRENSHGLDLNRDFMKLETPEANGLVRNILNRWDPHVTIDLHTTNGSYHGYHLTYAPSLNPNADQRLIHYQRTQMLPTITKLLADRFGYRLYYYGNFMDEQLRRESTGSGKVWATFDSRPRFGTNYLGLRNRLAILSEAYSYADFKTRVDVTEKFVRTILEYAAQESATIRRLINDADKSATLSGLEPKTADPLGVGFKRKVSHNGQPVEILVGSVDKETDERTGRERLKMTNKAEPVPMLDYGEFAIDRALPIPAAYLLRPDQQAIIEKLRAHGVAVAQLVNETSLTVEAFIVEQINRSERTFQKHNEVRLTGRRESRSEVFPAGTYLVSMAQPLGRLAFYLLEPESDDGLVTWNYFDPALAPQKVFPVYRLRQLTHLPQRLIE